MAFYFTTYITAVIQVHFNVQSRFSYINSCLKKELLTDFFFYKLFSVDIYWKKRGRDSIKEKKESEKRSTNTAREGKTGVIYVLLLRN